MSFSLSFDRYMGTLDMVPKIQSDYKRFKEFDTKKKEIQSAHKQHLADAQNADSRIKALKKAVQDTFDKIMRLTGTKPNDIKVEVTAITDVRDLATALTFFNDLGLKIEKSGGTEPKPIKDFCAAYKKILTFLTQCESNQFSLASYKRDLDKGQERALSDIEVAIAEMYSDLRMLMGFSKEDIRAHQKFTSGDKSLFTSGFHFPETLASGIKLGNATIEVSAQEAGVMQDVYPEIECKKQRLTVPYIFPINSEKDARKSNIYIEFDGSDSEAAEQVSMAVHQLILKIISECPLGNIALHCADTSENEYGRFVYINANFKKAINKIKDGDISQLLIKNLCELATDDVAGLTQKEFKAVKENQYKTIEGAEIDHHLYVYFEMSPEMGTSACDQLKRSFELDRGCGAVGVHNIIIVNKATIQSAKDICAKETSVHNKTEAATAWLNLLEVAKRNSDCFDHLEDGNFLLIQANEKRTVSVQLGDKYFPSLISYDTAEKKLIETIEHCNVEAGSPFIDLNDEKAFDREGDFQLGEYADGKDTLRLRGNENIAVIFSDTSFTPDEKSRIMSSLTLGTLTALKPGQKRLCFMSNQHNAHVMNVMNGLEGQSDGIRYSLLENDKSQSAQQRTEYWRESIRSISKILNEKKRKSGNKRYDISDLISEDSTKYLRVVYDEYTDDGQRYDDNIRSSLVPDVIKLSRETNGGVQCVLEIDTNDPHSWQHFFTDSGVFDYVFVAKNHGFVDENNRRLKLSVLTDKDDAQAIAHNVLKSYIKASVTSPRYEDIGFGSQTVSIDSIGSTIEIPVGRQDGTPFSMDFDSKGNGIIGYMVQGTTGSGKSSLLFSMIYNGSMKYSPDALQFYLLDFKDGTSFDEFRNFKNPIPHVKQLSIKNDMEDADAIFRNLEDEVVQRSILFKKHGAKEISEYNKLVSHRSISEKYMPRLIIIIDECQNAFYSMDSTGMRGLNDLLVNRFEALTRVGRSYGIHFVVATQRMEARLAEKIGAQLSGRCSFKMNSVDDASALFSHSIASRVNNLPRYGAMLFSNDAGKTCTQVQVAYDYGNFSQYAREIRGAYPTSDVTFEIGNEEPLRIPLRDIENGSYLSPRSASIRLPLAQNCMKDGAIQITFAQGQNQSLLMIGENTSLASNIMVSLMHSANKLSPSPAKTTLYSYTMNSVTVNLARSILGSDAKITNDAASLLEDIYFEIEKRDEQRRTASEGADVRFQPWLVILDGIRKDLFEEGHPASSMAPRSIGLPEKKPLNLTGRLSTPASAPERHAPERTKVWQTITEMASDVGIFLCVYLADPRSIPSSKDFFKGYKHLITFPCQAIKDCITQRTGISIPMESTLGNKHVAFHSKLHSNAAVCYYVTDSGEAEQNEELSGGSKVYKIRPYILD